MNVQEGRKGEQQRQMSDLQPPLSFVPCCPDSQFKPCSVAWNEMDKERHWNEAGVGAGKSQETEVPAPQSAHHPYGEDCTPPFSSSHLHHGVIRGAGEASTSFPRVGAPDRGRQFGDQSQDKGSLRHCCPTADGLPQLAFHPSSCFLRLSIRH